MSDLHAVAGAKVFIGGVLSTKKTDFIAGDFAAQTWVEIDGWETCGSLGDAAETISTPLINRNRVVKQKGPQDAGSWENNFVIIEGGDAGQALLIAAQATKDNYAFKVEWPAGDVQYFIGLVMSKARQGGGAATVDMISVTIEINSNIVDA